MTGRCLSLSLSCPLEISLILRLPRLPLEVHYAPLSHHPCFLSACQKKSIFCVSACCSSPHLTFYPSDAHSQSPQACVDTHTLTGRNTGGEPEKIWVTKQVSGSSQIDVLCWPSVIMDGSNGKGWYPDRKHGCSSSVFVGSQMKGTHLMTSHSEVKYLVSIIVQPVILSVDAILTDLCLRPTNAAESFCLHYLLSGLYLS